MNDKSAGFFTVVFSMALWEWAYDPWLCTGYDGVH